MNKFKCALFLLLAVSAIVSFAAGKEKFVSPRTILWTQEVQDEFSKPLLKDEWRDEVLKSVNWDYPGLENAKKAYVAVVDGKEMYAQHYYWDGRYYKSSKEE